jgi:ribonucleoside-diphosphate reductase alpha chain
MSNLCSEILQVQEPSVVKADQTYEVLGKDISCNLGSMNIALALESPDFGKTVEVAIRALTAVSDISNIDAVPTIDSGNKRSHAVGLGAMNLHGALAEHGIMYGSPDALDFTNMYFYSVAYYAIKASNSIAKERGETFDGFKDSTYASGYFFDKYVEQVWEPKSAPTKKAFANVHIPTQADWAQLREDVMAYGLYNQNLQAVPPTGSISYINNSVASILPITSMIEIRKEGKIGRLYYPAPHMTNENLHLFKDAYEIGNKAIIDTYAVAQQHVDQGMSLTLFFKETATTRDLNKAQIYAHRKGIKTLYYVRLRTIAIEGTENSAECVSCSV